MILWNYEPRPSIFRACPLPLLWTSSHEMEVSVGNQVIFHARCSLNFTVFISTFLRTSVIIHLLSCSSQYVCGRLQITYQQSVLLLTLASCSGTIFICPINPRLFIFIYIKKKSLNWQFILFFSWKYRSMRYPWLQAHHLQISGILGRKPDSMEVWHSSIWSTHKNSTESKIQASFSLPKFSKLLSVPSSTQVGANEG